MVCADTNCWMAYLAGETGRDVEVMDGGVRDGNLLMAPVVLSELLSIANLTPEDKLQFVAIPLLDILPDYWHRAGGLRAELLRRRYRTKLADTLIAQSCIDHDVGLITRDRDFRPFARYGGLRLLV